MPTLHATEDVANARSSPAIAFGPAGSRARPFAFDRQSGLLRRDGVEVPLPPRVVGVLDVLLQRPGQLVTKQEIIASVWRDAFVTETSLAEAISVVRQALGDDRQQPTYIQTLHRRGYRLIAAVGEIDEPPRALPTETVDTASQTPAGVPAMAGLSAMTATIVALFAVVIAIVAVWQFMRTPALQPRSPVRFAIVPPDGVTLSSSAGSIAVSRDGALIAFVGCRGTDCSIYLRPLADAAATPVAGTAGGSAPFFSPDSRALGFFADGHILTLPLSGGAAAVVGDARDALGATWLRDGRIIFAGNATGGLRVGSSAGGPTQEVTHAEGGAGHTWPAAVADESAVVFTAMEPGGRPYAALYDLRRSSWHRLLDGADAASASLSGYLLAQRAGQLIAAPFDRESLSVLSLPVNVSEAQAGDATGGPRYAASAAGHLIRADASAGVIRVTLDWSADLRRLVPRPAPTPPR